MTLLLLVACADPAAVRRAEPGPRVEVPGDSAPADDTGDLPPDDTGATGPTEPDSPARYPAGRLQSPITPWVRDRLQALAGARDDRDPRLFMKVGDSITEDPNALGCYAGRAVDLGERDDLQATLDHFLAGDAGSDTPFDRESHAAKSGETADWAISDDPSPLERELDALSPAFAVVQYGTNDMQMGSTHLSAIWGFADPMLELVDQLVDAAVIPLLVTIPPRGDSDEADDWVPVYNAVVRGIAEARQVPLVDLEAGLRPLDDYGLYGDGVHLEPYPDGACRLTGAGLAYGSNTRNLLVLDGLDRLRRAALEGEAPDTATDPLLGSGLAEDPYVIDRFPFTDLRDTRRDGVAAVDRWEGCSSADESGAEVVYRLELERRTTVRVLVFDQGDVDVDIHVLRDEVAAGACEDRDDSDLELELSAGTWYVVADTYASDGEVLAGEYLLVITEA